MLDRQHGKFVFECDGCDEVLETDTGDFNEAREAMNLAGWQARKWGTVWIHSCPECAK